MRSRCGFDAVEFAMHPARTARCWIARVKGGGGDGSSVSAHEANDRGCEGVAWPVGRVRSASVLAVPLRTIFANTNVDDGCKR